MRTPEALVLGSITGQRIINCSRERERNMDYRTIAIDSHKKITMLTLNRPREGNSMNQDMAKEFREAIESIKRDPEIRVLILMGAGKTFCAGADLNMLHKWLGESPVVLEKTLFGFYRSFLGIADLAIPTIAALNGAAIGAGACLTLACDLRITADDAKVGFTFVKLGINPGMGSEYFLSRLVGHSRAFELLATGDILSAEEALRIGLVNRVVPPEKLMGYVIEYAEKLAAMPIMPIRVVKESLLAAQNRGLAEVLQRESAYQSMCFQTKNMQEGISAAREKREPRFQEDW
jgi:enoyl-CoA hydratase/carnithine racemase